MPTAYSSRSSARPRPVLAALFLAAAPGIAGPLRAQGTAQDTAPASPASSGQVAAAAPHVVRHTVERDDTLWDIAGFYLKDPFRWPEVFHANTDIVRNPHWIYPGQVLTIDGAAVKPEIAARVGPDGFLAAGQGEPAPAPQHTVFAARPAPQIESPQATALESPPALTVRRGEYEAAPYAIDDTRPLRAGRVLGAVESLARDLTSDAGFRFTDRLFVTRPADVAVRPGTELLLARRRDAVGPSGRVLEPTAIVRVDSAPATGPIIAMIVRQYSTVFADQLVLPVEQSFVATTVRPIPGTYPVGAKVLWIRNRPALPSLQDYVILSPGGTTPIRPGDQFTLIDDSPAHFGRPLPPIATATVTVVRVTPFGASAIVVDQTQPEIRTGMPARLSARMP